MVTQVQFRRGTTAQHASFTGANGEITIDTDKETVVVHDGTTAGGFPLQTTSGLSGNVAALTANNTLFVGSVSAANVVSNAQLSANLGNYQTTAGLNANIASYLPTYTGVVNGSSHTVGSSFIANATGVYHTGTINAASFTLGSNWTVNSTGAYHTGTINAASHTVGANFIANTSQLTISAIPFSANGGVGTSGQILYSNGATGSPYWAAAPAVIGNSGIVSNSSGIFVNAQTPLVANATGLYISTSAGNGTFSSGISAITVDAYGRVTSVTGSAGYSTTTGTVTSIANGVGISGGTITSSGTLSLATAGAGAASYTSGISAITVDAYGRVTSVTGSAGYTTGSGYVLLAGNQTFTGGFSVTAYNLGTGSGTVTPSAAQGNYQYITNNGAFTLAAPSTDCAMDILVTNGASAGSITLSGFTAPSGGGGDTYATTNTYKYLLLIRRINGTATYAWKALQ